MLVSTATGGRGSPGSDADTGGRGSGPAAFRAAAVVVSTSEQCAAGSEHLVAHDRDWRRAVRQQAVVELLLRSSGICRQPVLSQPAYHELAECVGEISRIIGAAQRLLARVAGVRERLLAKHGLRLFQCHATGVQTDG